MNYYIKTPNKELNIVVQKTLFELGYIWRSGSKIPLHTEKSVLAMDTKKKTITFWEEIHVPETFVEITFAGLYSKKFIK